uniref:Uncharacterized protein n=1 Tax=Glossina austeni TaxID=7395 RepID=A0A1A9UVB6_GLOAU
MWEGEVGMDGQNSSFDATSSDISSEYISSTASLTGTATSSISIVIEFVLASVGKELLYAKVTLHSESVSVLTLRLPPAVTVSPWNPSAEALDVGSPADAFDVDKASVNGGAGMILGRLHFNGVVDDVVAVACVVKATYLGTYFLFNYVAAAARHDLAPEHFGKQSFQDIRFSNRIQLSLCIIVDVRLDALVMNMENNL